MHFEGYQRHLLRQQLLPRQSRRGDDDEDHHRTTTPPAAGRPDAAAGERRRSRVVTPTINIDRRPDARSSRDPASSSLRAAGGASGGLEGWLLRACRDDGGGVLIWRSMILLCPLLIRLMISVAWGIQ